MQNQILEGEAMESTLVAGRLTAEFIAEREDCWVEQTGPALVGCGDDRSATAQSSMELSQNAPELMAASEAYASIFGAEAGVAKNVLIVGVAQYGPQFIRQVGGMHGITDKLHRFSEANQAPKALKYVLHTAEGNENADGSFCAEGNDPVGCAYSEGVGATSWLLVQEDDSLIRDTARQDQLDIFGDDMYVDALLNAHETILRDATDGQGADYKVGRTKFVDRMQAGVAVMTLAGKHAPAKNTGLILNFETGILGSSQKAAAEQKPFYREDVVAVAADLRTIFKEYDLDPELLMRAFVLDSTPVRAVLTAHDTDPELHGNLDPRGLAMGWRGDVQSAIATLKAV